MNFKGKWRDYQARILEEMDEHLDDRRLHVVAAPGAGKTVLGLEIARRLGRPALVFAPTIAIRDQWEQRLCPMFLDARPAAGAISYDLAAPCELTLATYQALDSLRRSDALDALIETLNGHGPLTLVLDEAHHLRREWWKCLVDLANRLEDVRLVALTATPPYDASFAEWSRYEELCGPIDLEIGIPELVRNGDLCPHQDHLILSTPHEDALDLLERRRRAHAELADDLRNDDALLDWLAAHLWLTDPEANVEAILDAPEMLSAVLVLLASAGRKLPKPPLKLLGVAASDVPPPSLFWLERLLDGLITQHAASFPLDPMRHKSLRDRLHCHGLIEGGRVRLHHTRSVFKLMSSSLAKLDSIVTIARAETEALGNDLRMVVLSDHIRAGELPTRADADYIPAKLGVVPIFETLRRSCIDAHHLGVLTGTLVLIPKAALDAMNGLAAELGLAPGNFRCIDLPGCPDHVGVECRTGGSAALVRVVTALFVRGDLHILVGTQSLLGEGWDAPVLNSLVLASNTASFMLSNQMRGRAIRIDPARPDKVANIWHLATIDPADRESWDMLATSLNWGFLNDEAPSEVSDLHVVARRFKAFEGISNGASTLIEDGLARLGLASSTPSATSNLRTFRIAADRPAIAERWRVSLGQGAPRARARETAAASHAPRALSWFDTLHALGWSAIGAGAMAAANELRAVHSFENIGLVGMGIAGVATLASLPRLLKAGRLLWRNGSLEGSLREVAWVTLRALVDADVVSGRELDHAAFEIRTSLDGRKDVILTGVSRAAERQVMQAIAEILGPVQNPRYLLVRRTWLGPRRRVDYHAVPAALGTRKEVAERFAELWRERIGSSDLVFARTVEGRRLLLRARASSFAGGFQRSVDRRSVWL
ncbi:DEAD/DEAH box helicase family protein [Sphingomonas sp. R647]|uniref:DEAD/DEAH box helicase family protein n=1 Tax=Sphingomonas sp. R647 TaxID=2875233 RepID=UPI001CD7CFBE|nr:DEAD/DEAH box helicase family protein [Sphingomonas sp. R647]MCA1196382.1 DEAD/DEAH box helicase family protein [Sphingomonas sp. R647]